MIHPEDQARLDQAKHAMEIAAGPDQSHAAKLYRITENKAIRRALTDLDELLSKSPVKSANRMLAYRHIEDASMRLGKDLQECAEPNPYPNSKDTSNTKVDPTAEEVAGMPPHQARVLQEHVELDQKLNRLKGFMLTETFNSLPEDERGRLTRQYSLMKEYADVLAERIAAF